MSRNDFILGRIGKDGKAQYRGCFGAPIEQPELAIEYDSRSAAKRALPVHGGWIVLPRDFMIALTDLQAALND